MDIEIIPTARHVDSPKVRDRIAVVFDILRATSTMVTALANGAKGIFPAYDLAEAVELAEKLEGNGLLAGEYLGDKLPDFHLGNSPSEYTPEVVKKKYIILTTTNGTKAIRRAEDADLLLIGSFLNMTRLTDFLIEQKKDLALICAGTQGRLALEDLLAVGMVISQIRRKVSDLRFGDLGLIAENLYRSHRDSVLLAISSSQNGHVLKHREQYEDLRCCARVNSCPVLPAWNDGVIELHN